MAKKTITLYLDEAVRESLEKLREKLDARGIGSCIEELVGTFSDLSVESAGLIADACEAEASRLEGELSRRGVSPLARSELEVRCAELDAVADFLGAVHPGLPRRCPAGMKAVPMAGGDMAVVPEGWDVLEAVEPRRCTHVGVFEVSSARDSSCRHVAVLLDRPPATVSSDEREGLFERAVRLMPPGDERAEAGFHSLQDSGKCAHPPYGAAVVRARA